MSIRPSLPLASRLQEIKPSATVAVSQRAQELKAQGVDVLSFSVGEPDFGTPAHIQEAAVQAMRKGATRYTAVRGIPELRQAICDDSARRRGGVQHVPNEVVVSVGAKHSLFNLSFALFEAGDEIIVPAPYWVSYPEQATLAGAKAVIVETSEAEGFRLQPEALRRVITPKTKALVLCSPSNPTGAAYDADALRALAEVAAEHSFWIIVDEIYAHLSYGGFRHVSMLEVAPELKHRIIVVDGVSKAYAMTGWRIGWMLAPKEVAAACDTIQGQSTTNPTSIAQYAALAALQGPQDCVEEMRRAFEGRRKVAVEGINRIPGMSARMPEGAFYVFASVRGLVGRKFGERTLANDLEIAQFFLEEARCALVPGSAFGAPGYVRLSYATANAQIEEGLRRMQEAVAKLS